MLAASLNRILILKPLWTSEGSIEDFVCRFANPAACAMIGGTEAQVIGLRLRRDLADHFLVAGFEHYVRVCEQGLPAVFETEDTFGATYRAYRVAAFQAEGNVGVSVQDVTALKTTIQKVRAHEAEGMRLAEVIRRTKNSVVLLDTEGRTEWCNAAFTEMTGYTLDDIIGRTLDDVLNGPETDAAAVDRLWSQMRTETGGAVDVLNYRKDGTTYWARARMEPLFENGRLTGYVSTGVDVTQEKLAEQALAESEARMQEAFEIGRMFSFDWYPKTGQLYRSVSCMDILGFTDESQLGDTGHYGEHIHPDDRERHAAVTQSISPENPSHRTQYRYIRDDGNELVLEEIGRYTYDEHGEPVRYAGLVRDLTAHSEAERAREVSDKRYRLLANHANDVIMTIDTDLNVNYVSPSMEKLLGFTPEEVTLANAKQLFEPDSYTRLMASHRLHRRKMEKGEASDQPIRFELEMRSTEGKSVWVEWISRPFRNDDGSSLGYHITLRNITEQYRAESALRERERHLRLATEAGEVGTFVYDIAAGVVHWSEAGRQILGLGPGEATTLEDYVARIHPDDQPATNEAVARASDPSYGRLNVEYRFRDDHGQYRWIMARGETTFSVDNRPLRRMGVIVDISARKAREQALIEAKEAAEEAAGLKSALLRNMSHEIRTPLTGIIGFADLMRMEADGPASEFAELIHTSGRRLMTTLNSVMALAQLESGTLDLNTEPLDVAGHVKTALTLYQAQAEEAGLDLTYEGPDQFMVAMDVGAFDRVLSNLVTNAIKFTEEGSVHVVIEPQQGHFTLRVRDTGIGIDTAFMPRLFDAFAQESVGDTRLYEGIGLGMTITRQLVSLLGGTIRVESEKQKGTTFEVVLPTNCEAAPPSSVPTAEPAETNGEVGTSLRVLAVEDQNVGRLLLQQQLRKHHHADVVGTVDEALAQAHTTTYDVVLLDISLGEGMSGTDLMHALRERPSYADTPIIALTAHSLPGDAEHLLKEGFDAYLAKPFTQAGLLEAIDEAVRAAKGVSV